MRSALPTVLAAILAGDGTDPDIVIHCQMLEHPSAFRHHDGPLLYHVCPQLISNVFTPKFYISVLDKAVLRFQQAADGAQRRRFSGSVGSQQGNNAAFGHTQANAAQHLNNIIVDDFDIVDIE